MSFSTTRPLLLSSPAHYAGNHKLKQETKTIINSETQNKPSDLQRFILMHPRDTHLPYLSESPHCVTRTLNATTSITFVDLTPDQAKILETRLAKVKGTIQPNAERHLGDPTVTEEMAEESVTAASAYPNAAITCAKITMSNDFVLFFPDTMVDKRKFPKANLTIGNNYSGSNKPCNPHSNYTFSIFEQVLGDPKLQVINIPVFTCGGGSLTDAITNGLMDILDYAKANPNKKVAMYFAVSGGGANPAETAVVQELVKAGVMVGVSAGNNGYNLCNKNIPPWNVPGVLQIGATMPPGDRCPFFTNWSDVVPNSQFGDCVNAYLPGQFKIKQFNVKEKGTSFAIPQAVGWVMRWWNQNPKATAAQAIAAFQNHTVVITKQGSQAYPPLTASGKMRVVTTADYCNTNVSSNSTSSNPRPRPS